MSNALLDPATLRARAEKCHHLAAGLPPDHNRQTLLHFAQEYDEIASKIEASITVIVSPIKTPGANGSTA
jgi:hypothetical protein